MRRPARALVRRLSSSPAPTYAGAYAASMEDPLRFWGDLATSIHWARPPSQVLDSSRAPFYEWYGGGTTSMCYNALDAHVEAGRGEQPAVLCDSAVTGERRTITYRQLLNEVELFAGVLRSHGVGPGDRVLLYLPMVSQGVVAMLACARIGAVHTVVFGGFGAPELAVRIEDTTPKLIVTASCGLESTTRIVRYGPLLEAALAVSRHKVGRVIVLQRPQWRQPLTPGRDVDYEEEVERARGARLAADPLFVPSQHPLYILATSGSTGRPKQVVRDTGGHAVALKWSMRHVMGLAPGDVWAAFSDLAW
jgi:propionyl-CoA synthetase